MFLHSFTFWNTHILFALILLILSCDIDQRSLDFTQVEIEELLVDSLSIRAIQLTDNDLFFACDKGTYGWVDLENGEITQREIRHNGALPHFRAVGQTPSDLFMLSIANPALLYKMSHGNDPVLVYEEHDSMVFYDAMEFWNEKEGIAVGDIMNGCLSIIVTRDGGSTWNKLSCAELPEAVEGEGAFAASNTNISVAGDHTWIATTAARIHYSPNKGLDWVVFQTPIVNEKSTQGIYSIDFLDENVGIAIGGDFTSPDENEANKAITHDGGRTWQLIANKTEPNYKSCVQFIPGTNGKGVIAVGFTGVSYSSDLGKNWVTLSEESLYTIRFVNDREAYGAGQGRIVKLTFY